MSQFFTLDNVTKGELTLANETEVANQLTLEKAMALHSSTLAWKISWMEEPGRL